MNLNKDILIGFGVGLFTGGGAGVFIATKQAEARADAEIASVKEEFHKLVQKHNEWSVKSNKKMDKMTEILGEAGYIIEDDEGDPEDVQIRVPDEKLEAMRLKLTGAPIADADPLEEFSGSHAVDTVKAKIYADQDKIDLGGDIPYVITVEQFEDEHVSGPAEHDKQTITYFVKDDKLVDGRDEIIRKRDKIVGDFKDRFGDGSNEEHIVYVRNCWTCVDYEIVRENGSYADYISKQEDGWEHEEVEEPQPVLKFRDRE